MNHTVQRRSGSSDALLWHLENGAVLRASKDFEGSNLAFNHAETIIRDFDSRAVVSARDVAANAAATVTNLNAVPYTGYGYDRVMLNTYKALNFMALNQINGARVELLRAYERQKEALKGYREESDDVNRQAAHYNVDISSLKNDPHFNDQLKKIGNYNSNFEAIADYVNPLTVYLDGIFFAATSQGGTDLERARLDFERVNAMLGGSDYLNEDLAMVEAMISGQRTAPVVYVIFENGLAPIRQEIRIDIPTPIKEVRYVAAAFPKLAFSPAPMEYLNIYADGKTIASTVVLSDMDQIIANDLNDHMNVIVSRTLISSALKAAAQYELYKEIGYLANVTGILYSVLTDRADLRTWLTLPKEFQFARFTRPNVNYIDLESPDADRRVRVELPNSEITLVYAKAIHKSNDMILTTIGLR